MPRVPPSLMKCKAPRGGQGRAFGMPCENAWDRGPQPRPQPTCMSADGAQSAGGSRRDNRRPAAAMLGGACPLPSRFLPFSARMPPAPQAASSAAASSGGSSTWSACSSAWAPSRGARCTSTSPSTASTVGRGGHGRADATPAACCCKHTTALRCTLRGHGAAPYWLDESVTLCRFS